MVETAYRVISRTKHRFDVEMAKADGRRKMIEGFVSEHEANAWIIQAQRLIRAAGPWTPLAPRKPHVAVGIQPLASMSELAAAPAGQDGGTAPRSARVRPARDRSRDRTIAKP
jgi:hypothetical protein